MKPVYANVKDLVIELSQWIVRQRRRSAWLDKSLLNFMDGMTLLLEGRKSGAATSDTIRGQYKASVGYKRFHEIALQKYTGEAESICVDNIGVGKFVSRVCDHGDFENKDFLNRFYALHFKQNEQHRKSWEKTFVSLLVDHFGLRDINAHALGIGVRTEVLLFYFAQFCEKVTGIDLYGEGKSIHGIDLESVYEHDPFNCPRDRLELLSMDMRSMTFADNSFDFVWSISCVEHVNNLEELFTTFEQIQRVLKPGGFAFITTEWNLIENNPSYTAQAVLTDRAVLLELQAKCSMLQLIGPVHIKQSKSDAHIYRPRWMSSSYEEVAPLFNISVDGNTFATPIVLVLRKR